MPPFQKLKPKTHQEVYFSHIKYANDVLSEVGNRSLESLTNFTLVTGIANANPLLEYLNSKQLNFKHLNFKDHHEFNAKDLASFKNEDFISSSPLISAINLNSI